MRFSLIFLLLCFSAHSQTLKPKCDEVEEYSETGSESVITKTCIIKDLKFVSVGTPDNKGRYFWEYEVYKLDGENYTKTENSKIFRKTEKLKKLVNRGIEKSYESDKQILENAQCIDQITLKKFGLDEMQVTFDELGNAQFITSFEISSACLSVDRSIIKMKIEKFLKYLK